MTRFRFVSLSLAVLLCLGVAAPAMAVGPYLTPAGLVAAPITAPYPTPTSLEWMVSAAAATTAVGPLISPSGLAAMYSGRGAPTTVAPLLTPSG